MKKNLAPVGFKLLYNYFDDHIQIGFEFRLEKTVQLFLWTI